MAMNLLNPIQLLRGTSAAIAAAQGKEGTLYYDMQRGNLIARGVTDVHTFPRVVSEDDVQPTIYVDAANGDDNNSGFAAEEPVKTLDRAFWLCNIRVGLYPTIISLADGIYATNVADFPDCLIYGHSKENTIINIPHFSKACGYIQIYNCTLSCSGNYEGTVFHTYSTVINLNTVCIRALSACNIVFYCGDSGYSHLTNCELYGDNIAVSGDIFHCNFSSSINTNNISLSGSFDVSGSVVAVGGNSYFLINKGTAISNNGQLTGKRYIAYSGGIISSGGTGTNAIPGTEDGSVATGGAYY